MLNCKAVFASTAGKAVQSSHRGVALIVPSTEHSLYTVLQYSLQCTVTLYIALCQ